MNYALTVRGTTITGVHEGIRPFTQDTFAKNPRLAGDEVRLIEDPAEYAPGTDLREYDANGMLRPLVDRILEGYAQVPPGYELIEGELVRTQEAEAEAPPTLLQRIDNLHAALENVRESLMGRLQMLESVQAWSDIARGETVTEGTLVVFLSKRYRCVMTHQKTLLPTPANDTANWVEDT